MKRWISLVLCAILFMQCVPTDALAQSGVISENALAAAYALSGQGDDAAQWHRGMTPENGWNAEQLDQWLESVLDNELYAVQNAFADLEVTLSKIEAQDAALYAELTGGDNAPLFKRVQALRVEVEQMRETLRTARSQLVMKADVIANACDGLSANSVTLEDQRLYSYQIDSAVSVIRAYRDQVTGNAGDWLDQINDWHGLFTGEALGAVSADAALSKWIRRVMDWRKPALNYIVSSSVMNASGGLSRMAKLSTAQSALSGGSGEMNIHVMSDKEFAITVNTTAKGDDDKSVTTPVGGGWVTVWDENSKSDFNETVQASSDGTAIFSVSKYQLNADGEMQLTVQVEADGYRIVRLPALVVKKGGRATVSMEKDDGKPYMLSMSFNATDMLHSQRQVMYSPYNDVKHEISAAVIYPGGYTGSSNIAIKYYDAKDKAWKSQARTVEQCVRQTLTRHDGTACDLRVFYWDDQWKQLLGPGKTVSFYLGDEAEGLSFKSMLTVARGDVDRPFTDATGTVMSKISDCFKGFGNLFTIKLPGSFPKAIAGSQVTFDLPFLQYLPKICWDMDGTLTVAYGVDIGQFVPGESGEGEEKTSWRDDHTWKTQDQKDIDARVKEAQKKSKFAGYKAKCGAMWDGVKSLDVHFLGTATASFGAFAMVTGRFKKNAQYKDPDGDYFRECRDVGLMLGGIFTFSAEWTAQWAIFNGTIGVSASAALGLSMGLEWENFSLHDPSWSHVRIAKGMSGLTILLKIMLYVSVGVGIHGVAEISVTGYGYISVLIQFTASEDVPYVKVTAGAGIYAMAQLLIVKVRRDIWISPEILLFSTNGLGEAASLSDALTAAASTNEGGDAPLPMEPESYPALVPEAQPVMTDVDMATGQMRFISLEDTTFAFYIAPRENGKNRVTWRNLNTGTTGTLQAALESAGMATANMQDFAFCVSHADTDVEVGERSLKDNVVVGVLCADAFMDETVEIDGEASTVKSPKDSTFYCVLLAKQGDTLALTGPDDGLTHSYAFDTAAELGYVCESVENGYTSISYYSDHRYYDASAGFGLHEYVPYAQKQQGVGGASGAFLILDSYRGDAGRNWRSVNLLKDTDVAPHEAGDVRSALKYGADQLIETASGTGISISWYALEQPAQGSDECRVVQGLHGGIGRALPITERGRQACFFDFLRTDRSLSMGRVRYTDLVFYIEARQEADGERHRLKTAKVVSEYRSEPLNGGNGMFRLDRADYGVEVATASFKLTRMGDFVYLYWLSTASGDGDASDTYRLMGVTYDMKADEMSNALVLAEFTLSDSTMVPTDVFLSNDGRGYCTVAPKAASDGAAANVYAFPFQWVTRLDISAAALTETLVNPGDFVDVTVTVTNSGNTGICDFDIDMLTAASDSDAETTVETVHSDCLNPDNNTLTMNGETVTSGQAVLNRLDDAVAPLHPATHVVTRTGWTASGGDYTNDPETLDNPHLMPGAVKSFVIPLKIPADWSGEKAFTLNISRYSTNTLWMDAAASAANALDDENQRVTYARTADGRMARADDVDAPFHPANVLAPEPLKLDHSVHDLDVDHRVYRDADGEMYLSITFLNHADVGEVLKLYAELYIDDTAEPVSVNLPYARSATTGSLTHTLDLRLKDLFGDILPSKAEVVIRAEGVEELALRNNALMLYFNEDEAVAPLVIVIHPRDVVARPGDTAVFTVAAAGGVKPYAYQWQVWMGAEAGWKDIPGANADTLTVEKVTLEMNGRKARCVVTDHNLSSVTSDPATLTVATAVATGDDSNLPLYLTIAFAALALMWVLQRRRSRI